MIVEDASSRWVFTMYLPFLADFQITNRHSWGSAVLAHLYRALCRALEPGTINFARCHTLVCTWAWVRFTTDWPPS
ncbi:hypothetical protein L6164_033395 [Bauhinia variegata]|uniref:Uncharacterized protein n=1 Tax=Bauhinia variegata TaxID=167791 RepID=A0ACB9KSA4_BAUVA|nr:hypothetical protein L6164_033395 [Bauhinia variegata]